MIKNCKIKLEKYMVRQTYHHANKIIFSASIAIFYSVTKYNIHELVVTSQCSWHLSALIEVQWNFLIQVGSVKYEQRVRGQT